MNSNSILFTSIPSKRLLYFIATFCLPSQILIILEIHTETLVALALISAGTRRRLSTLPHTLHQELFYILLSRRRRNVGDGTARIQ